MKINVADRQSIIDKEIRAIVEEIYSKRNDDDFYYKGIFNTKNLPFHDGYGYSPNTDETFKRIIYTKLNSINKNHCLYWFELDSEEKAVEFSVLLNEYRIVEGCRKVPATNLNGISKILYLGVRQGGANRQGLTNIEGRINQHLGYYKQPTTQGLQLYEYTRGKDFNICLKVVEFEGLETYCLNLIEKLMAQKMKPLCGRH